MSVWSLDKFAVYACAGVSVLLADMLAVHARLLCLYVFVSSVDPIVGLLFR